MRKDIEIKLKKEVEINDEEINEILKKMSYNITEKNREYVIEECTEMVKTAFEMILEEQLKLIIKEYTEIPPITAM